MLSAVAIALYPCMLKILSAKLQEIRKYAKHITKKARKYVETPYYDVSTKHLSVVIQRTVLICVLDEADGKPPMVVGSLRTHIALVYE